MKQAKATFGYLIVLTLILALAWATQAGWFYQTGTQWFDSCWAKANANGRVAASPEEAIAWSQCEDVTKRALFDAGYVFAGNPEFAVAPELKAIVASCPSNYSDIPLSGVDLLAVSLVQNVGGPNTRDRFSRPDKMIVRAFDAKWPHCTEVREKVGIPKIVKKDNEWVFESLCKPCEAERKAHESNEDVGGDAQDEERDGKSPAK